VSPNTTKLQRSRCLQVFGCVMIDSRSRKNGVEVSGRNENISDCVGGKFAHSLSIKANQVSGQSECIYKSAPICQRSGTSHHTADYAVNKKGRISLGEQLLTRAAESFPPFEVKKAIATARDIYNGRMRQPKLSDHHWTSFSGPQPEIFTSSFHLSSLGCISYSTVVGVESDINQCVGSKIMLSYYVVVIWELEIAHACGGRKAMLQKLGDHIKNCLKQASEAQSQAHQIINAGLKTDFLNLEKAWLCLAQSFIQCERMEQILLGLSKTSAAEWFPASSAPFDRDIEVSVIDRDGTHPFVFPCRRILAGWINAGTKERIDVRPTHWREWMT
jgi:hypothetical protein